MKNFINAPVLNEFTDLLENMYRLGWDERNAGNVSLILDEDDYCEYIDTNRILGTFPLDINAKDLAGRYFLITGSGKYFRNARKNQSTDLGVIRINPDGQSLSLLWGLEGGSRPTSELNTHLLSHSARLQVDPYHRVLIHTHATNLIAMSFVHELSDKAFTKTLWKRNTECLVVFPDGIGVLPWMVCGNAEIGHLTAEKFSSCRLVIWAMHGILGTGRDLDEAFGLIETAEKAAAIHMQIKNLGIKQEISDEELDRLAQAFNVTPRRGYLQK
ncbi:MAG: rhamnulose-1-phosphate aldolase [Acholeplasmataceae bacterium]|nr:rhamnulose-1-phosphate aldolase [Acholeplasmataceae bacterium]